MKGTCPRFPYDAGKSDVKLRSLNSQYSRHSATNPPWALTLYQPNTGLEVKLLRNWKKIEKLVKKKFWSIYRLGTKTSAVFFSYSWLLFLFHVFLKINGKNLGLQKFSYPSTIHMNWMLWEYASCWYPVHWYPTEECELQFEKMPQKLFVIKLVAIVHIHPRWIWSAKINFTVYTFSEWKKTLPFSWWSNFILFWELLEIWYQKWPSDTIQYGELFCFPA